MRPAILPCLLFLLSLVAPGSAAGASWDDLLGELRSSARHGPTAVYLGSADNHLPRLVAAGAIDTAGIPFVVVGATAEVRNPLTDRPISGARLAAFFAATAGTVVFLDEDGLPIPQLAIP